ncbi:MAG: hypothetical protein LBG62_00400 [Candidatus Methanoplasma sp.]|nr:hypothetical protein [Candidatus Methanoplasma sp.]
MRNMAAAWAAVAITMAVAIASASALTEQWGGGAGERMETGIGSETGAEGGFMLSIRVEGEGSATGGGRYAPMGEARLTASPSGGFAFSRWILGGDAISAEAEISIRVDGDMDIVARFEPIDLRREIAAVNSHGDGVPGEAFLAEPAEPGSLSLASARPFEGYAFDGWYLDGALVSDRAEDSLGLPRGCALEARFSPVFHRISVSVGAETLFEPGRAGGGGSFRHGSTVSLEAEAHPGYVFAGWREGSAPVSAEGRLEFAALRDASIEARFRIAYDAGFEIRSSSESAPAAVRACGSPGPEAVGERWTVADALTGAVLASSSGPEVSFALREPSAAVVEHAVAYSDGHSESSREAVVADGVRKEEHRWRYSTDSWHSGLLGMDLRQASLEMEYRFSEYFGHASADVSRSGPKTDGWVNGFIDASDRVVSDLAARLQRGSEGMSPLKRAQYVSNFVQSAVSYEADMDGKGAAEYYKFPCETLYEGRGDCEDSALLFLSLMRAMGYECGLLRLDYGSWGHAAPMARIPGAAGYSVSVGGTEYVCCEVTCDPGFFGTKYRKIGDPPNGYEEGARLSFHRIWGEGAGRRMNYKYKNQVGVDEAEVI